MHLFVKSVCLLVDLAAHDIGVGVGTIYSDVFDGNVASYVEMMRFNANSIASILR